ncbi:MAG: MFS transporter [Oscillospiraceae bacterium]|nr:MFS transporter [Oscillospiraceae bacterium]
MNSIDSKESGKRISYEAIIVAIAFLCVGLIMAGRTSTSFVLSFISKDLQLDNLQLGMITSVVSLCWAISSVVISVTSDLIGKKKIFLICAFAVFTIASAFMGAVNSFGLLLIQRAAIGMVGGPMLPLIQSTVSDASKPVRRGRNIGIVMAGSSLLSGTLAPLYFTSTAMSSGWRNAFVGLAVPGLIVAVLIGVFFRDKEPNQNAIKVETPTREKITSEDWKALFVNRNFLLGIIGAVACIGASVLSAAFTQIFLVKYGQIAPDKVALFFSVGGIGGILSYLFLPAISDRFGRKPVMVFIAVCTVLTGLTTVWFCHNFSLLLIAALFGLLARPGVSMIVYVIVGESVPKKLVATAYSILLCIGEILGGTVGPTVGGKLADMFDLRAPMYLSAALGVVLVIVSLFIKETSIRKSGETKE